VSTFHTTPQAVSYQENVSHIVKKREREEIIIITTAATTTTMGETS